MKNRGFIDDGTTQSWGEFTGLFSGKSGFKQASEKEAEAFDREFLYMEKKKLLGQIF